MTNCMGGASTMDGNQGYIMKGKTQMNGNA